MSAELEGMFNNIILRKVPLNWQGEAYLSLKPLGSWFDDFLQRVKFMNTWIKEGKLNSYWVSAFYFPQGFMTASLQTYARKTKLPIDELVFQTYVLKKTPDTVSKQPEDGVNIHGMILQGCAWDERGEVLCESERKKLFQEMPVIW